MFFKGFINDDFEPVIEDIEIITEKGHKNIEVILDTGFNGAFCLPRKFKEVTELQKIGKEDFELADGTIIEEDIFIGHIVINNQPIYVELSFTDSEKALIGMELLEDKITTIDFKKRIIVSTY